MIHIWSIKLANYLENEVNLNNSNKAIVSYGLEVAIGGIIKLGVFIIVPYLLGILEQFTVVYLAVLFLRLPSGGMHFSAYYRCLLYTLLIYIIIVLMAKTLAQYQVSAQMYLWLSLLFAILVFIKRAPYDVKEKPIKSRKRRIALKIFSILIIFLYFIISILWQASDDFILATSMAVIFHAFTLSGPGKTFFKYLDRLF